ncbi:restriction endonuclease subunit S [Staphylococcus delphini]|uniref:restriction endonuclease subunit S n=1 Tax=Staphylococcus delphini TaxID=53344 RepID=UPI0013646DEF|nr:restriction endonuclease subunit S [Staphylococcus delphini]NBK46650.1 restriction endonuclease subunit S [Staphylococcus delphini]
MTDLKRNVPELRFPEFEDEWEEKKIGEIVSFGKGKLLGKKDLTEDGKYLCILYGELYTKYGAIINNIESRTNVDPSKLKKAENNQILIPSSGETVEDIATASALVVKEDVYIGGDLNILTPKKDDGTFISLSLNSVNRWNISKLAQVKTVVHLYNSDLKKLEIKMPKNIKEQQKIGDFFSKLDRQIELEEEKLALLEEQKKGYMQKIFSQTNVIFKSLEDVGCFFTDGNYGENYPKSTDMTSKENGIAFLRGSNLKNGKITLNGSNYITKEKHQELKSGHLNLNDIVIAVRGSLGALGYVDDTMVGNNINSQLAIIRTGNNQINSKYLIYYLMSHKGKKELLSRITGTALKQLPLNQIKQVKVPTPPYKEQQKIGNFFSKLDRQIEIQSQKIDLLKQRKQGFLQKMFV